MGAAGDMLLAALAELGAVDPAAVPMALGIDAVVTLRPDTRGGLAGTRVTCRAVSRTGSVPSASTAACTTARSAPAPTRAASSMSPLAPADASIQSRVTR